MTITKIPLKAVSFIDFHRNYFQKKEKNNTLLTENHAHTKNSTIDVPKSSSGFGPETEIRKTSKSKLKIDSKIKIMLDFKKQKMIKSDSVFGKDR